MPSASPDEQSRPHGDLSPAERTRYSRQLLLSPIGEDGQRALKGARVLVVGAGGLGSPCALYLAAAGVGTIGLVDHDVVDLSNLHRQLLHGTSDVGRPKLESARARLAEVNPHVQVVAHDAWLTSANALDLVAAYDVVVDGTDNFATRYLVNDACVLTGTPNVHGSVFQFDGQASVFCTEGGPCYRCLYPEPPPPHLVQNCAEGGVLGVLPGLVGTVQAVEAIKLLLGIGESLAGRLLMIDALSMSFREVTVARDPACPLCGTRTITALVDYAAFCGTPLPGDEAEAIAEITVGALQHALERARDRVEVIDVREPHEVAEGSIAGATAIPLGSLRDAADRLDRGRDIVLVCRSGQRSARGVRLLREAGFTRVASLAGGMLAWEAQARQDGEPAAPPAVEGVVTSDGEAG